jgi:hypothetical protein
LQLFRQLLNMRLGEHGVMVAWDVIEIDAAVGKLAQPNA